MDLAALEQSILHNQGKEESNESWENNWYKKIEESIASERSTFAWRVTVGRNATERSAIFAEKKKEFLSMMQTFIDKGDFPYSLSKKDRITIKNNDFFRNSNLSTN